MKTKAHKKHHSISNTSHHSTDVAIFDQSTLREQLRSLCAREALVGPEECWDLSVPDDALASEERIRFKALNSLLHDPKGNTRSLIIGTKAMLDGLEALEAEAPNFSGLIALCKRAVALSRLTKSALRLPPILLTGESGVGKSRLLRRLGQAIGTRCTSCDMPTTAGFRWHGTSVSWRGAKPGLISSALIDCVTAQPIMLLDEFDKATAMGWDRTEGPLNIFHHIFEEESASSVYDDYYEISFDAKNILWFASANSIAAIPESIISRMLVIEVPAPTNEQLLGIFDTLYKEANARHLGFFEEKLGQAVRLELLPSFPREAKRILHIALGHAAHGERRALDASDIRLARDLVASRTGGSTFRHPIGFCAC